VLPIKNQPRPITLLGGTDPTHQKMEVLRTSTFEWGGSGWIAAYICPVRGLYPTHQKMEVLRTSTFEWGGRGRVRGEPAISPGPGPALCADPGEDGTYCFCSTLVNRLTLVLFEHSNKTESFDFTIIPLEIVNSK
jgi:hypothetical protein